MLNELAGVFALPALCCYFHPEYVVGLQAGQTVLRYAWKVADYCAAPDDNLMICSVKFT
jgi:hypothetical protein